MKAYELPHIHEVTIVQDGKSFTEDKEIIDQLFAGVSGVLNRITALEKENHELKEALQKSDGLLQDLVMRCEVKDVSYSDLEKARKLSFFTIRPLINPEQK